MQPKRAFWGLLATASFVLPSGLDLLMKQLYRLLLPLLAIGSLLPACSPHAYSGFLAPPAAAEVQPVLASATVVAPLAAPAGLPPAHLARAAPTLAQAAPAAQLRPLRAARGIMAAYPKTLSSRQLSLPARVQLRPRSAEVAGTPTGAERLEKLVILIAIGLALLGLLFMLLIKAVIHAIQKRHPAR